MPFEMDSTISIHAPREGGDKTGTKIYIRIPTFQSTPPARGATACPWMITLIVLFQSTPPARGATWSQRRSGCRLWISIHAPCEGGDPLTWMSTWVR